MTRRVVSLLALFALALPLALAQSSSWVPDKAHSEVNFTVLHMSLAKVRGRFGNIGGTIVFDPSNIARSKVNVTIDTDTVDTGVAPRDADLKSAHFFDVSQFPTATFVSTAVSKNEDGLTIAGNLTLHGITKPVVLKVDGPTGPVTGMDHKPHMGFSASTTIHRTDFGIGTQYPAAVIGDEIKLTIDLDVARQ